MQINTQYSGVIFTGKTDLYTYTAPTTKNTEVYVSTTGSGVRFRVSSNAGSSVVTTSSAISFPVQAGSGAVYVTVDMPYPNTSSPVYSYQVNYWEIFDYTYTVSDSIPGQIDFEFSYPVTLLTTADITIDGTPGAANPGSLGGSGKNWSLAVDVTTPGAATVSINKAGIESGTKNITLSTFIQTYSIGATGPAGGKIFHVSLPGFIANASLCHYLEAAPADIEGTFAWFSAAHLPSYAGGTGDWSTIPDAAETAIEKGAANAAAILALDPDAPAAKACADYGNSTNYDDWFLPNKDELTAMYQNRSVIGGFNTSFNSHYWSSSQLNVNGIYYYNFYNGNQYMSSPDTKLLVRPIRAF
jgi:hypothetical protein